MAMHDILCAGGCGMLMGQLGVNDVDPAAGQKAMDHQKKLFCKDCSAKVDRPAPKETPLQSLTKDLDAISEKVDALGAATPETVILKDLVALVDKIRTIAGGAPAAKSDPVAPAAPATPA